MVDTSRIGAVSSRQCFILYLGKYNLLMNVKTLLPTCIRILIVTCALFIDGTRCLKWNARKSYDMRLRAIFSDSLHLSLKALYD